MSAVLRVLPGLWRCSLVVLAGQSVGHSTDQLLPGSLAVGSEILPKVAAHPEVLGVHVQLVAVQLRQLGEGVLDAVQVLDGLPEGGEHLLAMGTHIGVAEDGRGAGQVPKGGEEPLCPGVDDQQPLLEGVPARGRGWSWRSFNLPSAQTRP
uniref:Secreted protein n=1 Tax=Amazona collaria TaxID=241587 RepID=A0A8B9GJL1_9PSIT